MAIVYEDFIHPSDKKALDALKTIPGFDVITKKMMNIFTEKLFKIENTSSFLKLGPNQMPEIYNMLLKICNKLQIDIPDLYLSLDRDPNAYTSGDTDIFIVVTSGLIETMTLDQVETVIAHECGHIVCHHVLYHTMGRFIKDCSEYFANGLLSRTIVTTIQYAFAYWMRCSEFSADRVAAYYRGSSDPVVDVMLAFAGGTNNLKYNFNKQAFLEQAKDYKVLIDNSNYNKILELMNYGLMDHPLTVYRAYEINEFYNKYKDTIFLESTKLLGNVELVKFILKIKYEYIKPKFNFKNIGSIFDDSKLDVKIDNYKYEIEKNDSKEFNLIANQYRIELSNGIWEYDNKISLNKNILLIVFYDEEQDVFTVEEQEM